MTGRAEFAVDVQNLWKFFGEYPALRGVGLRVARGRCLALLGRNGAGKTSLLRILAGLSTASRGTVLVGGAAPRESVARRRSAYLGHSIGIYDELTARENLMHFGRIYGVSEVRRAADAWLARVNLEKVADGRPREFSRGMRQRLAIARALMHEPDLVLLDEPFTSLDDRAIALLQELLQQALNEGRTVVLSTHQLREALSLATDVALLDQGKLRYAGPRTAQMLDDPGHVYSSSLGDVAF